MRRSLLGVTGGLALTALLMTADSSWGQARPRPNSLIINPGFHVPPALDLSQAAFHSAVFRPTGAASPLTMGFNPFPTPVLGGPRMTSLGPMPTITSTPSGISPGDVGFAPWFPSPWVGAGYGNSASAVLHGLADLTSAQGQYLNDWQRARLMNQSVWQAKVETRRQMLSLYQLERSMQPSLEELRERDREQAVLRARRDPPLTEILAGISLNDLLKNSSMAQAKGVQGPTIEINPEVLPKINLTSGRGGNIGLLKNEGKLQWPLVLQDSAFEKDREQLERLAVEAVKQAQFNNKVDAATLNEMRKRLDNFHRALEANLGVISTPRYIEATRYLALLDDALTALEDPNVGNFLTQKWAAKGETAAKLVEYLRKNGLRFAAAVPGDEAAYQALHHALASYDAGLVQNSVSTTPKPEK